MIKLNMRIMVVSSTAHKNILHDDLEKPVKYRWRSSINELIWGILMHHWVAYGTKSFWSYQQHNRDTHLSLLCALHRMIDNNCLLYNMSPLNPVDVWSGTMNSLTAMSQYDWLDSTKTSPSGVQLTLSGDNTSWYCHLKTYTVDTVGW